MTGSKPATEAQLDALGEQIDEWLAPHVAENPAVAGVERGDTDERLWIVRMDGDQRDHFAVWLTLRQRDLHYETYFMPAPEENHAQLFEHLLIRNTKLRGARFAIGDESAVYLLGQIPVDQVDDERMDQILGTMYEAVEQYFRPAMRIGFASKFRG